MEIHFDSSNIFNQIREAAAQVAELAQHVQINLDRLDQYAETLAIDKINNPPLDPSAHYLNKGKDTLAFFLTLETINFGSGYFPLLDNPSESSAYFSIAGALNEHYINKGVITATELSKLSVEDCGKIFKQSLQNASIEELMERFANALNQLGDFLLEKFDGKFEALFETANNSNMHYQTLNAYDEYFGASRSCILSLGDIQTNVQFPPTNVNMLSNHSRDRGVISIELFRNKY